MLHILIAYQSFIFNFTPGNVSLQSDKLIFMAGLTDSLPRVFPENRAEIYAEFEKIRTLCHKTGKTVFRYFCQY
jgi:hypothetical protein